MDRIVFRTRFLLLRMAMFLLAFGGTAQALEVIPMTLEETAYHAEAIFIGRVTAAQSRWGSPEKRWMVTDYAFDIEETILPNAEVKTGRKITLPFWGGVIGNEGQGLGGLEHPVSGQRYLIMLRPDYRGFGATPAVGVTHGLLQVVALPNGVEEVREYEGQPLYRAVNGSMLRREFLPRNSKATVGVTRTAFTNWLRANLKRIKATPPPVRPAPDLSDPRLLRPVAKTPIFDSPKGDLGLLDDSVSPPTAESNGFVAPLPNAPELNSTFRAPETGEQRVSRNLIQVQYVINRGAVVPLVFNQFPASFTPWSPEDQFQMGNWNYYGSDVFRIRANPTGTFAWTDGVSDIAGFINEATLNRVYGLSWAGGVVAWCSSRWFTNNNLIVESDISLNVGVGWTLDQNWVLDGSSAFSYRQVLSHELGHAHGLGHEDTFLSLMRASVPGTFAAFSAPFMDNAEAIRVNYPARVVGRTDLAIYLFNRASNGSWVEATFPSAVVAGNNFTVTNYHLENTGTVTVGTPTIEWYLTRQRDYNAAYYGIGSTTYGALGRFNYFAPASAARTLNVPTGVPAGDYYLNSFIPNDQGVSIGVFPFSNNYGWSQTKITVRPRLLSISLNPSTVTAGQSSTGTATISSATPTSLSVFTTTNDTGVAIPENATINAGQTTGTFSIPTYETAATRNVTIGGNLYGITASATLTVLANIFAPIRLAATAVSSAQITLTWQDRSNIESGYRIERKTGIGGAWQEIALVGANVITYSDTAVTPTTAYIYRVRAYGGATNSGYSNEAGARTRQSLYTINGQVTDNGMGIAGVSVSASGVNEVSVYFDGVSGAAITDNSTVTNTITVPYSGSLADVHVTLNITHTFIGDLRATLIAPDGTPIILHNRTGGGTDNLITLYPDATASAEDLAALVGKEINGNWILRVQDLAGGDIGTFNSWSLEVKYLGNYPADTYTAVDGTYGIAVPAGTYTITPSALYYEFAPTNQVVTAASDVYNVNFAAIVSVNNSITGRVTTAGGAGIQGVLVEAYASLPGGYVDAHSPGLAITDFTTVQDTITVPIEGILTGVRVGVNLTHTYQGDLRVTLIAPDGTEIILHNRTGGGTDNLVTSYPNLTASAEDLAILNGRTMTGNWTLRVADLAGGDSGTFNVWSLSLDYTYTLLLKQATTLSDGTYVMNGLPNTTYNVIPTSASFGFTPAVQTVTLAPSAANVDFVADGTVAVVSGIVELQQVVNSAQPITFEFRASGGGAVLFTETQTLGAGGEFALAVPAGVYDLAIKGDKWLRRMVAVDASAGDVGGIAALLRAGDANNDNYADISDLLLLIGAYNQVAPSGGYLEAADFNCDNANDIGDLLLLISNYNQQGDP